MYSLDLVFNCSTEVYTNWIYVQAYKTGNSDVVLYVNTFKGMYWKFIFAYLYVAYKHAMQFKCTVYTVKKITRFLDLFDQTFLGRGMGILFPARESLVSDIPARDGNPLKLFLQCKYTRK